MPQHLSALAVPVIPAIVAIVAAVSAGPASGFGGERRSMSATPTIQHRAVIAAFTQQQRATRYVVTATGNEARYRVREQLARVDFPSDAVGKTNQVTGAIVIGADGRIVRDGSSVTVDLAAIQSDNQRRDGFVRRNTLQTDSFPKAVFVPTSAQGLPATLPATGEITFQLTGDLTIHGVTRPTTWQVKAARSASGAVTGTATTSFRFGDFNMTIPKVGMVLSVDDNIALEYDFTFEPQPAGG